MRDRADTGRRGMMLVTVIVLAGMLLAFASALFMYSIHRSRSSDVDLENNQALTLADGGTEVAAKAVLTALADYGTVPSSGTAVVNGETVDYEIVPVGSPRSTTSGSGLYTLYQQYRITSSASSGNARVNQRVSTIIDAGRTPIFQFLNFFNDDLEILPGANMTLSGRIHTNKDLYVGSNATLTLNTQYVRSAGSMYRHRKDGAQATMPGTVKAQLQGSTSYVNWDNGVDSTLSGWATAATTNWGGTVQSAEHGVTPLSTPSVPSVQSDGYFHDNAGLVILDGRAYVDGADVTASLPAGTLANASIYDAREGKSVAVTTLDIAKLNASGRFPANGLVWAGRSDTTESQPNGIQLVNGSTLSGGLSVVSPDPVYIKGDYNTVAKKPAAVICDALNLLSNGWTNGKTATNGLPVATNTTYNAAFISGNVDTQGSAYSGGFENFPRFHENWTSRTCTIRGSFVQLWESQHARGAWVYGGNKYQAPTRNWDYDTLFNDPNTLPPFTPWTARVGRVVWWED